MNFFKKKEVKPEYLLRKEIPYNGKIILITAYEEKDWQQLESLYINIAWSVEGHGRYTSTHVKNLPLIIGRWIDEAKKYVDDLNIKPALIQQAKDHLNDISL